MKEMIARVGDMLKQSGIVSVCLTGEELIRCKDCKHWIPGEITDKDDFIPPRCKINGGGWSADEFCSNAERR